MSKALLSRCRIFLAYCFSLAAGAWGAEVGTSFTYQGLLTDGDGPANGSYDLQFSLFDGPWPAGVQQGATLTVGDVVISHGLITQTLDFGMAFGGDLRWLEIRIRAGDSLGLFTTLTPRQPLHANPYALYAKTSPWTGLLGLPVGFADGTDNDTTYSAGAGLVLTGGNIFAANFAGTGSASTVARSDHHHDSTYAWLGHTHTGLDIVDHSLLAIDLASDARSLFQVSGGFMINSGGAAIGIGADAPGAVLDVFGTRSITAEEDGIVNIGNTAGFHVTLDDNEIHARLGTAPSDLFVNDYGGNVILGREGFVGIGTGLPEARLHVDGNARVDGAVQFNTAGAGLQLDVDQARIKLGSTGSYFNAAGFVFDPGNTGLIVENGRDESSGIYLDGNFISMWSAGDGNRLLRLYDEDGMVEKFYIDGLGDVVANGVILSSSRRFKENVAPIENALQTVLQLQGVTFDWNRDHGGQPGLGFIAEDVAQVLPQLVAWEEGAEGRDAVGLQYANLTAVTVEAIKELERISRDQKSELHAKNETIQALQERVVTLERREADREERMTRLERAVDSVAAGRVIVTKSDSVP